MDVRRLVAALTLLGLLVSCSDDEPTSDPQEPTSSATGTPSPTETPTRPVIPAAAKGTDEASAKAFVMYWFEVFNNAVNTGESALLMQLSTSDCVSCKAFRKNIQKAYADGGRVRAFGWTPTSIRRYGAFKIPRFDLMVLQGEEEYLNAGGDVVRHFPGKRRSMTIQLIREGPTWLVQQLDIER